MFSLSIIVFREMIEICLILSIVIFSAKNMKNFIPLILSGILLGILGSISITLAIDYISELVSGMGQEIFNASLMFITAGFIFSMLLYTSKHAKNIKNNIIKQQGSFYGLLFIIAFTIFREGSEVVLLTHSYFIIHQSTLDVFIALTSGLLFGSLVGVAIYYGMNKISISKMFAIINWLLVFVIAGLIVQGVSFLIAADVIISLTNIAWDSSAIISEQSFLGMILSNLFGYISTPTIIELISYIFCLSLIIFAYKKNIA
jgi:high-affinity iron transporter